MRTNLRLQSAILAGKAIHQSIKLLNYGGGSAAPGLYALKIDPKLIENLAKLAPKTVMVTGTNGKTTTTRMLAQMAASANLNVLQNPTGSNLERGVASALIHNVKVKHLFSEKPFQADVAIWEVDEAAFNILAPKIKPDVVVFLNVFRDQLDRYGEIDTIINKWTQTLAKLPKTTTVVLNGNDPNLIGLKASTKGKIVTFGLEKRIIQAELRGQAFKMPQLDIQAQSIVAKDLSGSTFSIKTSKGTQKFQLPVPGEYHIYDFVAAYTLANLLNISDKAIQSAITNYAPAFGRVEKLSLDTKGKKKTEGYIFLIKNPYGATQVFKTIQPVLKPGDVIFSALNDNLADGTDISWIWDAQVEQFLPQQSAKKKALIKDLTVILSGTRADDLALRFKYADFDPKKLVIIDNLAEALDQAIQKTVAKGKGRLFILPTYTALLQLQRILAQKGFKEEYWKS